MSAGGFGALGIAGNIAQGVLGAVTDIWQGKQQAKMYQYQSGLALQRAQVADEENVMSQTAGENNALIQGRKWAQETGKIRAGFGAGNVAGTSQDKVLAATTEAAQRSEADVRSTAARTAFGYSVDAATQRAQAQVYNVAAQTSITAGDIGAATSILGGVTGASTKISEGIQSGMFGDAAASPIQGGGSTFFSPF